MTTIVSNNWDSETTATLPTGWTDKIGTWQVQTDNPVSGAKALRSVTTTDGDVVLYTATATTNHQADTKHKLVVSSGEFPVVGHVFRSDSGNNNHYVVLLSAWDGSTFDLYLFKRVSGSYTVAAGPTTITLACAAGDTIYFRTRAVGSAISCRIGNGSLPGSDTASWTDTTHTGSGYFGFYNAIGSVPAVNISVDDLVLDDTSSAATTTTLTGPTTGTAGVASSNFTVGADGAITGTVTVTPSDSSGGGTFTPTTVNISSGTPTATFTYTAGSAGAKSITLANSGSLSNPSAWTFTAAASSTKLADDAGIVYSPYNWDVTSTRAQSINPGAYFRTIFTGATCSLTFDMTSISTPVPRLVIKVDGKTFQSATLASSITVTMPTGQDNTTHLLEVYFDAMTDTVNRWNSPWNTAVRLTGIVLASSGDTLAAPTKRPRNIIVYGDSITEGCRSLSVTGTTDVDRNSATVCWSLELGNLLGAEVGVIGFGATGLITAGSGNVPKLSASYAYLWASTARTFSPVPDWCIWLEGTNDGSSSTVTDGLAALNGMLTAMPSTRFILFRPLNGTAQETNLQTIASTCNTPWRVRYISTSGFWSSTESPDSLHPYGWASLAKIAAKMAAAILKTTKTTRTATVTLVNSSGTARASLTGLNWAWFDEIYPKAQWHPADQGEAETTDGSGVLTISVQSSLSAGETGWLVVTDSDGSAATNHKVFAGPVVLS